jgi:5-methylcytosine-specific restriction endonuclease McrA
LLKCYKKSAKNRKKDFTLTEEQFKFLTKQNCYYCNEIPKNKHMITSKDKLWQEANAYLYNGIDRIDSNQGYTIDNCVTACKQCNQAKMALSQKEFFEWLKKIYEFSKKKLE